MRDSFWHYKRKTNLGAAKKLTINTPEPSKESPSNFTSNNKRI